MVELLKLLLLARNRIELDLQFSLRYCPIFRYYPLKNICCIHPNLRWLIYSAAHYARIIEKFIQMKFLSSKYLFLLSIHAIKVDSVIKIS